MFVCFSILPNIPQMGHRCNKSHRWVGVGFFNLIHRLYFVAFGASDNALGYAGSGNVGYRRHGSGRLILM